MIISLSDYNSLSEKDKKKTLANLKQEIGVSGIVKEWNISRSKVYSMMREYDISVNTKASRLSKPKKIEDSQKNENITNAKGNPKTSNPMFAEAGTENNLMSSQSTIIASRNESSKFHLYVETEGSAAMINETLRMLLESGRLTDSSLHLNMTLQEV